MSFAALDPFRNRYPNKFISCQGAFRHIHTADRIFIGTGCGEPRYLVRALVDFIKANPTAFFDTEVLHAWTLSDAPYADPRFKANFRANALFIGNNNRDAVNRAFADYTPVYPSQTPRLFRRRLIPIDVALIQTSLPDKHGLLSLGVNVDIIKDAVAKARLVIAQVNPCMPRVHGDTFIPLEAVHYVIPWEEPLLEFHTRAPDEVADRIGGYVATLVEDGDTIQVGYGSIPNAILAHLKDKKRLGVHSELLTDGIVELMRCGAVDNSHKTFDRGKTVATFCLGVRETYDYLDDNPTIEFHPIDYTNHPLVIARQAGMTAINRILSIDLTGQASAESPGKTFFSGIGGIVDFTRGALLAPKGKAILTLRSTTANGQRSCITPFLQEGAGVTLNRADVHYVVTEYGVAYLHGRNIRERAMALIAIAHPEFRPWLIEEAKKANLIYPDQMFIPGKRGDYPEHLETRRITKTGLEVLLRPVKISDEPLFKEFVYALSDQSLYMRLFTHRQDMPHEFLQKFVVVDYAEGMAILATIKENNKEKILGVGRYRIEPDTRTADMALVVRDDRQHQGLGRELLNYLTYLGKKQGLLGFTAEVLYENKPMLNLFRQFFEQQGFDAQKSMDSGVVYFRFMFRDA